MLQGVNEEGLRWDFTKGSLEGLQTDDELTSHLAGHTVQCGVDQTKNPTVNSPHLIHSTRRRVDFWATINTDSTSLVIFSFSFPSRQAFRLERMQKSRIPTASFRSIVDEYLSTLVSHLIYSDMKVVIVEKMLFEDCLVCHDPPSARISPSKENLPPPCRSTAG